MKTLPAAILLLLVTAAAADEPSPKVAAFLKSCEAAKTVRIEGLKNDIKELERLNGEVKATLDSYRRGTVNRRVTERTEVNGKVVFPNVQAKTASVEEAEKAFAESEKSFLERKARIEKAIANWESGESLCLPFLRATFQVGDIGMTSGNVKILQIIDEQNMLVTGDIASNPDDPNEVPNKGRTVWLRGVSTKTLADGAAISISGDVFEVVGNKTYKNALGTSNTVLVLEAFDLGPVKKAVKAAQPAKITNRTWTSADGNFSMEAEFVSIESGKVTLKKRDGKVIAIEAAKLSQADQDWLATRKN